MTNQQLAPRATATSSRAFAAASDCTSQQSTRHRSNER